MGAAQLQNMGGYWYEKDELIGRAGMTQLFVDIVDSVQLQLSPQNQAKYDAVQAAHTNARLSDTFAPVKLTTSEQDAKYAEYLWEQMETQTHP